MSFIDELKRRNVFRVGFAYVIVAWLLLQVADVVLDNIEAPTWVFQAIILVLVIGFPVALLFAWAFELTPEGLKREKDVDRSESITPITGRKLDFAIIAVLAVALVFFASTHQWDSETGHAETADKSIAVLAFADLSPEGDQEYFSDGIAEALLNVLAKIPGLRVAARTSSFQFKGENRDVIDIGQQLNVAFVLEGSVQKAGVHIRITAQLVDASNGFHLWSETYDRELANIFAVQDEISAAIVGALKEHLGLQVEAVPPAITAANIEAHAAYLRGRYLVVQRTRATIERAVREYEKALMLDPDFALAHAELAMATLLLNRNLYGDLPVAEAIAKAALHADRARALDPNLAEAHAAAGRVFRVQWNLEEALTHFEQAIEINPNYSIVYHWMAGVLSDGLGRYAEAFTATKTALRLDPLSIETTHGHIIALVDRNRLDEADRELKKLASIAPWHFASMRGTRTGRGGKWANSPLSGLDGLRIDPEESILRILVLPWEFAIIGLEKEARAISEVPLSPVVLRMLNRTAEAVTAAEARLAEDSISFSIRRNLGLALAAAGNYARARPILEEVWQRSDRLVTRDGLFNTSSAVALIAIRRDAGEEATVGELVAAIRDNVRRYREAGMIVGDGFWDADYEEGLADFLASDREEGLALIAKGAEDGMFILQSEAYLQVLYDDPGFAPIRASQEARQARERDRFLAIVCTDNPYVAVWQPAEGICEQFAAAGGN